MAKWTIVFEDTEVDGDSAVACTTEGEGEFVDGIRWTGATLCALFLKWAWEKEYFQRLAVKTEEAVLLHHVGAYESREESAQG